MKPGDTIICINKDKLKHNHPYVIREEITIGKQYKALPYPPSNVWQEKPWIIIKDDSGNEQSLMKSQFMLLEDWRQQQLDKLL